VDNFKMLNDQYGHLAGDGVLLAVAETINSNVRRSDGPPGYEVDIACRYGGEEFAVILPEDASAQGAVAAERLRARIETRGAVTLAERLRSKIEKARWEGLGVTVSIGVASYPEHAVDLEGLIRAADEAMYAAKRTGKNRIVVCDRSRPVPAGANGRD
jgi:diguanylate cyclase (GGDEF)-like protein